MLIYSWKFVVIVFILHESTSSIHSALSTDGLQNIFLGAIIFSLLYLVPLCIEAFPPWVTWHALFFSFNNAWGQDVSWLSLNVVRPTVSFSSFSSSILAVVLPIQDGMSLYIASKCLQHTFFSFFFSVHIIYPILL